MDVDKLPPDVKQKLLALTIFPYQNTDLDLDSEQIYNTITHAIRSHYIDLDKVLNSVGGDSLLSWIESNAVASDKVYKE